MRERYEKEKNWYSLSSIGLKSLVKNIHPNKIFTITAGHGLFLLVKEGSELNSPHCSTVGWRRNETLF